MRITIRLIAALVVAASAVVAVSTYLQVRGERARLIEDIVRRNSILTETLEELTAPALASRDKTRLTRIVQKYGNSRERITGLAIYDAQGEALAFTPALESDLAAIKPLAERAIAQAAPASKLLQDKFAYVSPVQGDSVLGAVVLVRDASFIPIRLSEMWRHNFFRLLWHALLISLVSLLIIRWNILAPLDQMTQWMKHLRTGGSGDLPATPSEFLGPLASEATSLARSLALARAAAEDEARLRQQSQSLWTPERLKEHVKEKLGGRPLFVVANREPYMHVRDGKKISVIMPASGLVTGLEPILRACGGMWLAHGAGDADREVTGANDKIPVPPDEPQYTLKRVWLSKEEEEGYYYGFSNEGFWPLCHIAHTRPVFRESDWAHYQAVNRKFADSLLTELEGAQEPFVLVQDYHFALLPRMIKQARPDARVAIFWHIPWPNPESFGICPWQRELLDGMLGADLVGFHIQYHCNNFLETVDRTLECRLDWERFAVKRQGQVTSVKPFPISIAFPDAARAPAMADKAALLKELGVNAEFMGIGVDRVDYTKGIAERFRGVERFLEKYPKYQGRFTFVEIGAPSRTHIKRYQEHLSEIEAEADRINWRFKTKDYKPIVFLNTHHSHAQIEPYYKAADLCMITSLSDGMNLVAKEFVASRDDGTGALILSRFTGAARDMRDALIVNPYDTGQVAEAIRQALEMPPDEQSRRMSGMRRRLKEQNIYLWAANLIEDLAAIRLPDARENHGA
ncbi:MAG: trehalose-6-phosphate synthase [Elusimicrobia bacterium]|nr:trehalose-6-phosphate synthase [Elusimicrobiota bacterium]